jgi:hypothetical protein
VLAPVTLKHRFEFTEQLIAKSMNFREALDGFGGLIAGFQVKDLSAAGMQLLVYRSDSEDGGDTAGSGEILEVHPSTEAALARVERGRDAALCPAGKLL